MDVPGRIPRERGARERFARAVDQGISHRDDQEFAEELAVVSALRRARADGAPDQLTRERIAARISAADTAETRETPDRSAATQLSAAGTPDTAEVPPVATVPRPRNPEPERERERPKRRAAPLLAAAFCLVLALAGIGTMLSGDSLPGDLLYQVKRAQESASLQLTLDEGDRARKRLEHAGERLVELGRLAARTEPGETHDGFRVALTDFGSDARLGVAQLTAIATSSDGSQLVLLREWVETQSDRLAELRAALPAEVATYRAETAALLGDIDTRASALAGRMGCYQITSGESDELGVLPSDQACGTRPGSGGAATSTAPSTAATRAPGGAASTPDPDGADARLVSERTETSMPVPPAKPTTSDPLPPTSGYVPREWLPAPAPTSISRPRVPDSVPEPPAVVSVPPLVPGLPGVGIG